jgi:phosphorylase kinase alpha/beta subunit
MTPDRDALPALTPDNLRTRLPEIEDQLARAGTLDIPSLDNGLHAASSGQTETAASGYQHAWIRDNVMVAYARWRTGDLASAVRTSTQIGTFLLSQVPKMVEIIRAPDVKNDVQRRPAVRFNARTLTELDEPWAHAQNDALACAMWLRLQLAQREGVSLSDVERELYATIAQYFGAIEFWTDRDNGVWEEARKVNTSSVGAVVAALEALERCRASGIAHALSVDHLRFWIDRGRQQLERVLPFESPPEREEDAALILLVEPLDVCSHAGVADSILFLVRSRLMGPYGIRRYTGDSYFCQDYDRLFPPEERSADFSEHIADRDRLLRPGFEAQWCLFDPLLSTIFGRRFHHDRTQASNLEWQLAHFNRAMAQLTGDLQCPELYYWKSGVWSPNDHTPLAWTQANLAVALETLRASAR